MIVLQPVGEIVVDARILLLQGNGQRQNLLFTEAVERAHKVEPALPAKGRDSDSKLLRLRLITVLEIARRLWLHNPMAAGCFQKINREHPPPVASVLSFPTSAHIDMHPPVRIGS